MATQKTFNSFSGVDITPIFQGKAIGEIQAISYSVNREKAPVYTMGKASPRSFARGKRGIAGSLIFIVFDQHALLERFKILPYPKLGDKVLFKNIGSYSLASCTGNFNGFSYGKIVDDVKL